MTLGEQLWESIEGAQGYAYLSDGQTEAEPDDNKVLADAAQALYWHRVCVNKLQGFLKRHGK